MNKRADIRLKDEADYICYLLYHNTYSLVIIHWGQFVHSLCFSPFVNLYTCYVTHLNSTDNFNLFFSQCVSCCHFYQWNTVLCLRSWDKGALSLKRSPADFFQISTFSPLQTFCLFPSEWSFSLHVCWYQAWHVLPSFICWQGNG